MALLRTMPLLAAIFAAACLRTSAAELPESTPFLAKRWFVPPGFLKDADKAQTFLEESGVSFPEGAFAKYFPAAHTLLVRNTQANIELVECMLGSTGPCEFPNLCVEILTREFTSDSPGDVHSPGFSLEEIRRLPRDRVRLVSQVSVLAKSGLMVSAEQTDTSHGGPAKVPAGKKTTDCHTKISVEPVVGPDGVTVDLAYNYQLQRTSPDHDLTELTLSGNSSLRIGQERLLAATPLDPSGRFLIVTVLLRQRNSNGEPLRGGNESPP